MEKITNQQNNDDEAWESLVNGQDINVWDMLQEIGPNDIDSNIERLKSVQAQQTERNEAAAETEAELRALKDLRHELLGQIGLASFDRYYKEDHQKSKKQQKPGDNENARHEDGENTDEDPGMDVGMVDGIIREDEQTDGDDDSSQAEGGDIGNDEAGQTDDQEVNDTELDTAEADNVEPDATEPNAPESDDTTLIESSETTVMEAFPQQPDHDRAHAQEIEAEVQRINEAMGDWQLPLSELRMTIREFLHNPEYSAEGVMATFGPSLMIDFLDEGDTIDIPQLNEFISDVIDVNPRRSLEWQASCKQDVIRNIRGFVDSGIEIDFSTLINNADEMDVVHYLDELTAVYPEFDVEDYLARVGEHNPELLATEAGNFIDLGYYYPAMRLARQLRRAAQDNISLAPNPEWRDAIFREYGEYLVDMSELYANQHMLNDEEWAYIEDSIGALEAMAGDPSATYHDDVVLEPVPEYAVASFNRKARGYRRIMDERRQRLTEIQQELDNVESAEERTNLERERLQLISSMDTLASHTLATFNPDELSCFRRLYIARSQDFDGDENMGTAMDYENPNYDLACLYRADEKFHTSDEFYDYGNRMYEERIADELTQLRVNYPQIFDNVDLDEIMPLMNEVIQSIPAERIDEIIDLKERGDFRQADRALVETISEAIGLPETPGIEYFFDHGRTVGRYNYLTNNIEMTRAQEGSDYFENIESINTIAHELWHAHQYDEIDRGTERGQLYETNFWHYREWHDNPTDEAAYFGQLVESEAQAFAEAFERLYHSRDNRNQTNVRHFRIAA